MRHYENFSMKEGESMDDMFRRLQVEEWVYLHLWWLAGVYSGWTWCTSQSVFLVRITLSREAWWPREGCFLNNELTVVIVIYHHNLFQDLDIVSWLRRTSINFTCLIFSLVIWIDMGFEFDLYFWKTLFVLQRFETIVWYVLWKSNICFLKIYFIKRYLYCIQKGF